MSISCCIFDFAPESLVRCMLQSSTFVVEDANDKNKHCFNLKFPITQDCFDGCMEKLLDKVWSEEEFEVDVYDEDNNGKRMSKGKMGSIEYDVKAGDCLDVKMVFSAFETGQKSQAIPDHWTKPARIYTSGDCRFSLIDDCGDQMRGDLVTTFLVQSQRNVSDVFGKFRTINNCLGTYEGHKLNPIKIAKRCKGGSSLDFGLQKGEETKWLVRLTDVNCEITSRSVKDGLDVAEISFQGKKS